MYIHNSLMEVIFEGHISIHFHCSYIYSYIHNLLLVQQILD